MRIAVFDSGIGGITVLHDALMTMPDEDYIYYADTEHVPYGVRTKDEIKKFVLDASRFIYGLGVKALVIACNTATSAAISDIRAGFDIPVIGMEPAVKPAVRSGREHRKRILVTATALTLREEKLHALISRLDSDDMVDLLPLPGLVELAERREFGENAVLPYLHKAFSSYNLAIYDTVVLGCTHFVFFKENIRKILPEGVHVIDGNAGTVNNLRRILDAVHKRHEGRGRIEYYRSGVQVKDTAELRAFSKLFDILGTGGPSGF